MSASAGEMEGPVAIVSGGGVLPFAVADAAMSRGRSVVLFPIKGAADADRVSAYPHHWIGVTEIRTLIALMRKERCKDVVMVGALNRPSMWCVIFDIKETLFLLPTVIAELRGGDNQLMSAVARVAERHGFRVRGAHEIAPEILVKQGNLTARLPTANQHESIKRGLGLLNAMGPFDVGQAVVVIDQNIVAIEGVEGTDAMLARVRDLRGAGRITVAKGEGVLVKAPKPQQDRRVDMPTIGPRTVRAAAEAGLAGIAVAAGQTLIAEPSELMREADRCGLFVVAVGADG